jgi:hypothetical protein
MDATSAGVKKRHPAGLTAPGNGAESAGKGSLPLMTSAATSFSPSTKAAAPVSNSRRLKPVIAALFRPRNDAPPFPSQERCNVTKRIGRIGRSRL